MALVAPDVHQAACDNDVEELRATLENNARLLEAETGSYRSKPLHWACIRGSVEAVKLLLELGADRDAVDASGDTPSARRASTTARRSCRSSSPMASIQCNGMRVR